jgi:hypothetical protein
VNWQGCQACFENSALRETGVGIRTSAFLKWVTESCTLTKVIYADGVVLPIEGAMVGDPMDLLHKASNGVMVLGLTLEQLRRKYPDDARLQDASKAYDAVSQLLKRLREVESTKQK